MADRDQKNAEFEKFQSHLETLGIGATTLEIGTTQTLRSEPAATDQPSGFRFLRQLHTRRQNQAKTGDKNSAVDLILFEKLAEGGMGVVTLASQYSLDREVAVKTTKEQENAHSRAAEMLLKEAYITGYLEHPNIIPIYTIGRDFRGEPLIVMKVVEGHSWLDLLEADGPGEVNLAEHIGILIQVCNAMRFAHSRGIVHLDIKPENVMIGQFGEVYLLDWGVALSLTTEKPLLPHRDKATGLRGTPCYMAPEMALQQTGAIDERTDVYLLGATLHHILTGEPRHRGQLALQVLFAASRSEPVDYDSTVPEELAAVANKACHQDPAQRYESVESFSEALSDFLRHRESIALSTSAYEKCLQLRELVGASPVDSPAIHDTYGECRFGFHQALRIWSENDQALQGLEKTLATMADYYIRQSNLEGATGCINELSEPGPELLEKLEELAVREEEHQRDFQRLKRLESNLDLQAAMTSRSAMMVIIGLIWTATTTYAAFMAEAMTYQEELHRLFVAGIRNVAIVVVAVFLFRKRILTNLANRRLIHLLVITFVILAVLRWSVWYLGEGLLLAQVAEALIYVVILMASGLMGDRRIYWLAIPFFVTAIVAVIWPASLYVGYVVATVLTFGGFAWIWRPVRDGRGDP